jgi:hypothetical protein
MSNLHTERQENPKSLSRIIAGGVFAVFLLGVLVVAVLMVMGPLVGNVFSTVNASLSSFNTSSSSADSFEEQAGRAGMENKMERLIIRDGRLVLVVKDTLSTQKAIEEMIAEMKDGGAFVVSSNVSGNAKGELPYVYLTVRVPAERFDEVMDRVSGMSIEVRERNATAQDVTAEYVDLKARLEALETARQRLLQIMQESATTESLLLAEKELTQREAEIESIKGRMQYLTESARLSSITIDLIPDALSQPVDTSWRPGETVRRSIEMLVNGVKTFVNILIVFVIAILPWLLLLYGIYLAVNWFRGRKKRGAPKTDSEQKQ